jgi:hypothetical protein
MQISSSLDSSLIEVVLLSKMLLTTGVDLRSAKICEVDNLPYMQNSGLSQTCRSKFQCYFDYYWTSVFKVQPYLKPMSRVDQFFHLL